MDDEQVHPSTEHEFDAALAAELRRLRPLLGRQRRAAAERPDDGFRRALRAQLTAAPRTAPAQGGQGMAAAWRTLIAMFVPASPQLSLRGRGPQVATYTADDLTISLAARPADGPAGAELISLYGEVD